MEMKGERTLPVDRASAWKALNDVHLLQTCIPGCESIVANAGGGYDLSINASIGPVKARFKGHMALTDVEEPNRYTLRFESQSGTAGFARGEARVSLEDGATRQSTCLRYVASAQVGGRLAQVGSRLIDAAAAFMSDQFFDNFARGLAAAAPAAPPEPATVSAWALFVQFLRRLFRG
jgi:carbon monoxide dehydrogenase subunit G